MKPSGSFTLDDLMVDSGVAFGTSGARGLVTAMTDRVCHGFATGFLQYLAEIGEFERWRRGRLGRRPAPKHAAHLACLRPSDPRCRWRAGVLRACADTGPRLLRLRAQDALAHGHRQPYPR